MAEECKEKRGSGDISAFPPQAGPDRKQAGRRFGLGHAKDFLWPSFKVLGMAAGFSMVLSYRSVQVVTGEEIAAFHSEHRVSGQTSLRVARTRHGRKW